MTVKYIVYYASLQHGYIALRGTYIICYIQSYIMCCVVDRYNNIIFNITK